MTEFLEQIIACVLSGSVIAAILGVLFHRRAKSIEQQLRVRAETFLEEYRSMHEWKIATLSRVLGPIFMHLERTNRAFRRWEDQQLFLEMEVIGTSNRYIRDILLENGHLIPNVLLGHASELVHHYDAWLEEFHKQRESQKPDLSTKFVFVGPKGYGFPHDSELAFKEMFHVFRHELYGGTQKERSLDTPHQ